jgi:3-oxoacyl-[acyl-carrier protein] reductase
MLSASFISTIIGTILPGPGSLWVSQTLEFLHPVYTGDTLRVTARVKQKSPATRLVILEIVVTNQHQQKIITGIATVKMPEITQEEAMTQESAKTIVITGGSGGIGMAVAHKLTANGYAVIINYMNAAEAAQDVAAEITESGGRAMTFRADVAHPAEVEAMFSMAEKTFGPVGGLVHCAAMPNTLLPFEQLDWVDFQQQLDIQVKGAFNCVKAAMPGMIAAGGGGIVFIGSVAADGVPPLQQSSYVVAKSALTALAHSLAVEYGPKNIRVNVVAPGMTHTRMIAHLPEKAKTLTKMQTPLRRLAEPTDIANAVAFLLGPEARHITGETLRVCGGATII